MIAVITPEREQLAQLVRTFLADRAPLTQTRRFLDTGGFDQAVWDQMGKELGLQGLGVPEEYDGAGYGLVELALVTEELGRTLYSGPFFSSICLAIPALLAAGSPNQLAAMMPLLASGEMTAALAFAEPGGPWNGRGTATIWRQNDEGDQGQATLTGVKTLVIDGASCDQLIVTAAAVDDPSALSFFLVDGAAPGLLRRRLPTLDQTRALATIEFQATPGTLLGPAGRAGPTLTRILHQASILLAAEQLGGAQRCLEMAVEYAGTRTQFGRPIGSFQAIKHRCADMLLDVETSRSAVAYALAAGDEDLAEAASLARAHCSEAFSRAASSNIQIHGGIGFTWEHDAHLYVKRAKSSEAILGSPSEHRDLLAATLFPHP